MKLKRNGYIYIHHMDYINIASSEIRKKLQSKKGVGDDAIPEKIRDYIAANNLYKSIGQVI
jgi:nicotinic acid mononucleotide adenylyltransferase